MFTDRFCRAHINSLNNIMAKLCERLEKLSRRTSLVVRIILSKTQGLYS